MRAQQRGYREDLAYIHDRGFGDFARCAGPALRGMLRAARIDRGRVVDLGCGSGILARQLIDAGYDVLGIDQSEAMLRIARRRAPRARFRRGSILDVDFPACVAVTAIGECLNYLFDSRTDLVALKRLLRCVHHALAPGGLLVFDIATPGRGGGAGKRQKNLLGDDWAILLETEEDPAACVLTRRIVAFRRMGKMYRKSEETHRLRLYRPQQVARELRRIGFTVRLRRGYRSMRLAKGWVVVVARKPKRPRNSLPPGERAG